MGRFVAVGCLLQRKEGEVRGWMGFAFRPAACWCVAWRGCGYVCGAGFLRQRSHHLLASVLLHVVLRVLGTNEVLVQLMVRGSRAGRCAGCVKGALR